MDIISLIRIAFSDMTAKVFTSFAGGNYASVMD
jgi:hypothetical protein